MFRDLRADEIDVRVATINEKGASLLLYKDARVDMDILDETVGVFGWQRTHSRDNANCTVSLWDKDKGQWISKEDTGTESNTEAAKGLASDSFKRACFNLGIGRELYTAPFVWISVDKVNITKGQNGKYKTFDTFRVDAIEIKEKKIVSFSIKNQKNITVYEYKGKTANRPSPEPKEPPKKEYKCCDCGKPFEGFTHDGKTYNAGQAYHIAESKNPDKKARCRDCRLKKESEG